MGTDLALLFAYAGMALSISFLCSLLEATLLSVRLSTLIARAEQGDKGAEILLKLKRERIDDAIAAILTLNTIAHTVGATLAGAQAAKIWGSTVVGIFSAVLTLLVLVFTEIIPKTLGTVHASRLVGFVGRTTLLLTKLLSPIVAMSRALTRLITRDTPPAVSRSELAALVAIATKEGQIPVDESLLLTNALRLERVRVEDVMTPRTVAVMMDASASLGAFAADPRTETFSRIPVHDGEPDRVLGYVLQRELLRELANGADPDSPIRGWVRRVIYLPEPTPLPRALRTFLEKGEHLAMVVDEFGGVAGVVTLEDVVETILGAEIIDESDEVADLRELAAKLRAKRLARRSDSGSAASGPPRTDRPGAAASEGDPPPA